MSDTVDDYRQRVFGYLAPNDDQSAARTAQAKCIAEAVFFPAFHSETSICVWLLESGTTLRFGTMTASVWYHAQGPSPRLLSEVAIIPEQKASEFWNRLKKLTPLVQRGREQLGLDGMSVRASFQNSSTRSHVEFWGPTKSCPEGQFVHELYQLAWAAMSTDWAIVRLEQLHGYLDLGLPARVVEGEVKRLRLFGRLSIQDRDELDSLFEQFAPDQPLVIDMTNFEGMGTLFHSSFVRFAAEHPLIAWAASPDAMHHLKAMNLNYVFEDTTSALALLHARLGTGS